MSIPMQHFIILLKSIYVRNFILCKKIVISVFVLFRNHEIHGFFIKLYEFDGERGTLRQGTLPTKPRFRSVPDVAVLNSQPLTGLLIKYQRLPRGFFWKSALPPLVDWLFYFLKRDVHNSKGSCICDSCVVKKYNL